MPATGSTRTVWTAADDEPSSLERNSMERHSLDSDKPNSLEVGLHANSNAKGSSLAAGVANLLNTVVGGGILSLPYAIVTCGPLAGTIYLLVFGVSTWYGCFLLLTALKYHPVNSYEGLAHAAMGRAGFLLWNVGSFLNCYGACCSYMILAADIIPELLSDMVYLPMSRSLVLVTITALIMFPLSAKREISALRYASSLAILVYSGFACSLLVLCASSPDVGGQRNFTSPPLVLVSSDVANLIRVLPLCAFSFVCSPSLFPILQEMKDPSPRRMRIVITTNFAIATSLYIVVSLSAYTLFGEQIQGDVLLNLASIDSQAVRLVRLAFGISLCLTYPCPHYAARRSLDQLLFGAGNEPPTKRLLGLTVAIVG